MYICMCVCIYNTNTTTITSTANTNNNNNIAITQMDTNHFGETDMSVTTLQRFSILVVSCATGHKSTFIHMSPPALQGRRSPSNWHLSVTQAARHRQVHNNGWWAVQHKLRVDRRGCLKDKEEKGGWVSGRGRRWVGGEDEQKEVRLVKLVRDDGRWERRGVPFGVFSTSLFFLIC